MSDHDSTSAEYKARRAESKRKYHASERGKAATAAYNKQYAELHKAELQEKAKKRRAAANEEQRARALELRRKSQAKKRAILNEQRRRSLQASPEQQQRAKARSKEWYAKNKDRVLQKAADYYRENRPAVIAKPSGCHWHSLGLRFHPSPVLPEGAPPCCSQSARFAAPVKCWPCDV